MQSYIVQYRIKRITGSETRLVRFPGGSSNTVSRRYSSGIMTTLTNDLINKGYKYYDWNISSGDAGSTTSPDGVYSNVVSQLSHDKVNMVLMHDIKWYTRDALRRIIQYGKNNGYTFERITYETPMIRQRVNN
jgi:peptidoglycan/xylan/chitin deacetylase (PgdA/CDA1 family)